MSWLKIDDDFEDHAKVEPLSDAAHRLWMRAACWCRKPANLHTNGFVPQPLLATIAKRSAPLPKLLKLARELVDARGGGTFEFGLWEPTDGGWRFHDWHKYQTTEQAPKLTREEAARIAGKRSAEARKAKHGTAQPRSAEPSPNDSSTFGSVRPNDVHRTDIERPEPPDPLPSPDPKPRSLEADPNDLTGLRTPERPPEPVAADPQANWDGSERETACPLDLVERAIAVGVPTAVAQALRVEEAQVLDAMREFRDYWTIGGGMGQKRRFWMRRAREEVRRKHEQNKLKPIGAIEHQVLKAPEKPLSAEYLRGVTERMRKAGLIPAEPEVSHG